MDNSGDAVGQGLEPLGNPVSWSKVEGSAKKIIILACGPSLRQIKLEWLDDEKYQDVYIIAVNRAHDWTERPNAFFTLDPNEWFYGMLQQRQRENTTYYAAVPDDYGSRTARWLMHQVRVIPGPIYLRRRTGMGFMKSKKLLSEDSAAVHTGNSAYGALGVAFHLCRAHPEITRQKKIVFLGLDGTREDYAYGEGAPVGSLSHLPMLFQSATRQLNRNRIVVVNGNIHSNIDCFSRMHAKDALEWLLEDG